MKHGCREERETASEHRAQESICSDCTSRVFLECINEIVESSLKDSEKAQAHHDCTDIRTDPMDVFWACPTEDEHTTSEEDRSDHHGWETSFWDGTVVVRFEALYVEFLVSEVDTSAY